MHLVVLYGYQGADSDAEQLALTEQLSDAALGEWSSRIGYGRIPLFIRTSGSGLIWYLLFFFCCVSLILLLVVLWVFV